MRHAVHLALILAAFGGCLLLIGCAPTPFVLGPEVAPPPGCIDLRARGGSC